MIASTTITSTITVNYKCYYCYYTWDLGPLLLLLKQNAFMLEDSQVGRQCAAAWLLLAVFRRESLDASGSEGFRAQLRNSRFD